MEPDTQHSTDRGATPLDFALALARRGLSVIPVPPPGDGHDGKRPVIAWKRYQTTRPTETELRLWFGRAPMNLAIITGAVSGVIVVVRGDGGFVIGPGSVHASGRRYTAAGNWRMLASDLPVFDVSLLAPLPRPLAPPSPRDFSGQGADAITRARAYVAKVPPPIIGQGSDADMFRVACRLVRGFGLTEDETFSVLWSWSGGRPGWTPEWVAVKVRNAVRFGTERVGGLLEAS